MCHLHRSFLYEVTQKQIRSFSRIYEMSIFLIFFRSYTNHGWKGCHIVILSFLHKTLFDLHNTNLIYLVSICILTFAHKFTKKIQHTLISPPTRNIACPHAMYSLIVQYFFKMVLSFCRKIDLKHLKRLLYFLGNKWLGYEWMRVILFYNFIL